MNFELRTGGSPKPADQLTGTGLVTAKEASRWS